MPFPLVLCTFGGEVTRPRYCVRVSFFLVLSWGIFLPFLVLFFFSLSNPLEYMEVILWGPGAWRLGAG